MSVFSGKVQNSGHIESDSRPDANAQKATLGQAFKNIRYAYRKRGIIKRIVQRFLVSAQVACRRSRAVKESVETVMEGVLPPGLRTFTCY